MKRDARFTPTGKGHFDQQAASGPERMQRPARQGRLALEREERTLTGQARTGRSPGCAVMATLLSYAGTCCNEAKLGVLGAAIVASLSSWVVFRVIARLPASVRSRQLTGAGDELLDLSEDVDPDRDHIRGSEAAPVTLVEYGDYQCPHCGQAHPPSSSTGGATEGHMTSTPSPRP